VQAYDRVPIAEIDTDDAAGLESKLVSATRVFRDPGLAAGARTVDVLRRLAALMETRRDHFSRLIARRRQAAGDAIVETARAIDGVRNAAEAHLRGPGSSDGPDGQRRTAGVHPQAIGVVVAISAFNHPLNLPGGTAIAVFVRDREAGGGDTAVLHRVRISGARGRSRRAVVPDIRQPR
jgi:acyl-CoA reductase-like NAD-dependent aldehyde dehydrogenase